MSGLTAVAKAAITVAIALALAIVLISLADDVQPAPAAACIPTTPEEDAEIRRMMGRGFDQAFQQQIASLYKVYVGNAPSVEKQRQYTKTGIENAVAAWRIAASVADAWEGCK